MKLEDALKALQLEGSVALFEPYWEDSERTIPEQGPRFLQPVEILRNREYAGLPAEVDEGLLECARQVRETPALTQLAWHCARLLYVHRDYPPAQIHCWPTLEAIFGDQADLIVALEAVPRMRAYHIAHGVPDDVTRATSTHFTESTRIYQQHHDGHWGVLPRVLYWLRNHTGGELYCLGRFEYVVRPFWGRVKAFQNDETGEVLALSCDGIHYDAQGFVVSSEEPASWKAHLIEEPETVRGFPIAPTGTAVKAEVTLPRSSWRCMLQRREDDAGALPGEHAASPVLLPAVLPGAPLCGLWVCVVDPEPGARDHLRALLEHGAVAARAVPVPGVLEPKRRPVLRVWPGRC